MLPVANRPILEHVIRALRECDIKDIVIVVGYKKERIMDYFEDGKRWDVNIEYVVQAQQLGTAHAIKHARDKVKGEFLVLNGDNLIESRAIKDLLNGANGDISILAVIREEVADYGVLIVDEDEKKVLKIVEKPKTDVSNYVNTGVYLFNEEIFQEIEKTKASEDGEYGIPTTIAQMIERNYSINYVKSNALWLDVVYAWDLIEVNAKIMQFIKRNISEKARVGKGVVIEGNVEIGDNTAIYPNSCIIGPVIIGDNCEIGPSAIIHATSIGSNVTIKPFSQIENSIIMNGVHIGSHASIFNSIIGENSVIRTHFSTEYGETVKVEVGERLKYFKGIGAIVGENCNLGANVLIKAGKMLGVNCRVDSGKIISSNLESNSIVM
jgi:glucose-1-phosphate thymidylyltransferase